MLFSRALLLVQTRVFTPLLHKKQYFFCKDTIKRVQYKGKRDFLLSLSSVSNFGVANVTICLQADDFMDWKRIGMGKWNVEVAKWEDFPTLQLDTIRDGKNG